MPLFGPMKRVGNVYLPLVLGMGLVEVEAVAEHDPGRDCDLGPARITANKTKKAALVRNQQNARCAYGFPEISTRAAA
jgi:hypothetical protein